jgi:aspartyl aminopeptidase
LADAQGLIDFIAAGPSPSHCVAHAAGRLEAAGFQAHDLAEVPRTWEPGDGGFIARAGTLIAWRCGGEAPAAHGFRMVGAHSDSPNLRLKPNAEVVVEGFQQWGVEVYGGVLLHTWTDRDLGVSGRVALKGPQGVEMRLVRVERPIARVANLAIHLQRKIRTDGLLLNAQKHMVPLVGLVGEEDPDAPGALQRLLAETLQVDLDRLLSWDLGLHDLQPPVIGGLNSEFVFAPRLDNQASCYMALEALLALDVLPAATSVLVFFDHEEVGSRSSRGAGSALLRDVLTMLERDHALHAPGGVERASALSWMLSADMSHGVHPNFADRHEPGHKPRLNGGPVVKTNANQHYATEAETAGRFKAICAELEIPTQDFVNRTDLACGTTIGPISAAGLAIRTVDIGGAMLSMHSIREQCGVADAALIAAAMTGWFL